jgi:hypothetical protein
MKTIFPAHIWVTFPILLAQTYLLIYASFLLLRRMKLLKRPYSGMDYAESVRAAVIILGVLLMSSVDAPGIFQAAKSYGDSYGPSGNLFFLFFVRSFLVILFFSLLFIIVNYLNIRFLFRGEHSDASLAVSILFCAVAAGFAAVCWFTCKEVVDGITPRYINF